MSDIRRFTTQYEPVEDRVRLSIELKDEVQVLWLTRRLLSLLIPSLLERMDTMPSVQLAPKPQVQVAQRFSQQAAVSNLKRQKNVVATPETPQKRVATLVTSIQVRSGKKGMVLDFKGGEHILRSLPFSEVGLRQWLSVLHQNYSCANWAEAFWPSWISSETRVGHAKDDILIN